MPVYEVTYREIATVTLRIEAKDGFAAIEHAKTVSEQFDNRELSVSGERYSVDESGAKDFVVARVFQCGECDDKGEVIGPYGESMVPCPRCKG